MTLVVSSAPRQTAGQWRRRWAREEGATRLRDERFGRFVSGGLLLAVVAASEVLLPERRPLNGLVTGALIVAAVAAMNLKVELPSGHWTSPAQLVFVPMLFLVPVNLVPAAVLACSLLERLLSDPAGRSPGWPLAALENTWFCVAPTLVVALANPSLRWSAAPVLAAVFAAQLAGDFAASVVSASVEGRANRELFRGLSLTLALDGLLTPVALLGAAQLRTTPAGGLLVLGSVAGLSGLLARERNARVSQAEDALHDPLTGLANRRLLEETLARALTTATRHGHDCTVLMLDLDGFKQLNDRNGHHSGDLALIEVANRLRDAVRASDVVARIGGDEFTVVLPNAGADEADLVMTRIADAFVAGFDLAGRSCRLGVSAGSARFPAEGSSGHELVALADSRMYDSKKDRRRG